MDKIEQILESFKQLADVNDWHPKHTTKNLAMAVSVEAAELLEIFQWLSEEELKNLTDTQKLQASDEIADVFIYLLGLADKLGVDIIEVATQKMNKNKLRFPGNKT